MAQVQVCKETLAADVKVALLELKVEASVVEAAASKLRVGFEQECGVGGKLVSTQDRMHLHLDTSYNSVIWKFKGDCEPFCGEGEHGLCGALHTDDFNILSACTSRFLLRAIDNQFSVIFYDTNWKILGRAECCGIPDATGNRDGKGSWTCA